MNPHGYTAELRQRFPDLTSAIDAGDRQLIEKCYSFARTAAMEGDDAVQNASGVSFIQHLNFQDGKVKRR